MTSPKPMTRTERAALIEKAKRAAMPVACCTAARVSIAHLVGDWTREELLALVIVLGEGADHALLAEVTRAADDGTPGVTDADVRLRQAHAEAARLRAAHLPVPNMIRVLDSAYHQARKAERELAEAAVPVPDPQAEHHRQVLDAEAREHYGRGKAA